MSAALSASIRRVVGEEKSSEAPYSILLRRIDAQSDNPEDQPVDIILSGKHKDLFNVRVTDEFVKLLVMSVAAVAGIKIGVLDLSCNNVGDAAASVIADQLLGNVAVRELRLDASQNSWYGWCDLHCPLDAGPLCRLIYFEDES